jgi:peptidyl-prolyl cis-trans isomerase C
MNCLFHYSDLSRIWKPMSHAKGSPAIMLRAARCGVRSASILSLALCGWILTGPARAAGTPEAVLASPSDGEKRLLPADPALLLNTMAEQLDQQPDFVVLQFETLPITQRDVAGVIRAMPVGMAGLGFQEVYRRALDITLRQKAMVLHARSEKLDKDPTVIHQGEIAFEHVLADAWLKRRADAAVTDKALHERYDRDVAGKPGPEEVRARVILVPTEAEAQTVIQQIRSGADFADLARQYSTDPTAADGGDLGYVTRNSVAPAVSAAMFALSPGQVTPYPVASSIGFFVIRVEGRSSHKPQTFEEARPALEHDLRADAIRDTINSLLANVTFIPPTKAGEQAVPVKQ